MVDRDVNPGQGFGATRDQLGWSADEDYWRDNWVSRPYAESDRTFDYYQPGYRYGFDSAHRLRGRQWRDVEGELRAGWERLEHRGERSWQQMKDAIHDAWDRVTNR